MPSPPPRTPPASLADLPLVIETPRLVLRPIQESDVEQLWPYVTDPDVAKTMSWDPHKDRKETLEFAQRGIEALAKGTGVTFVITLFGNVIGCLGIDGIRWDFRAWRIDRAELGYWIGKPHWKHGYTSEAALAATRWAFETLGLHKITIGCVAGNLASQKIIEKIGYRFLAIFEEDFWRDGRWQDHRRYELTAGEWADSTRTLRFDRPRS